MLDSITPVLLTHDEESNIERTLAKLDWARRIVVVDSGSTDRTLEILLHHPRVELLQLPFTDFAAQRNHGLNRVTGAWVLSLDADHVLSDELIGEMAKLRPGDGTAGYRAGFVYCVHGRPLRGSLYPPRVVLFRSGMAFYKKDGHAERLQTDGKIVDLQGWIRHDDRKPLSRWLASQRIYAHEEADHLLGGAILNRPDRLRRAAWPAPFAVLLYVLFVKRCILDGWPGWYYALQRLVAEAMLALELVDRRYRGSR